MTTANIKRDNIPVPAALLLLGAVLWVLIAGPNLASMATLGDQIESFMDRNGTLVMISVVLVFFNAFSVSTYISKFWSYKKQGSRLRDLVGERQRDVKGLWSLTYVVVSATILYSCVLWISTHLLAAVVAGCVARRDDSCCHRKYFNGRRDLDPLGPRHRPQNGAIECSKTRLANRTQSQRQHRDWDGGIRRRNGGRGMDRAQQESSLREYSYYREYR